MESSRTGVYARTVVNNVVAEWDVQPNKVIGSLTDNEAAFQKTVQDSFSFEEKDEEKDEDKRKTKMKWLQHGGTNYEMSKMHHTMVHVALLKYVHLDILCSRRV